MRLMNLETEEVILIRVISQEKDGIWGHIVASNGTVDRQPEFFPIIEWREFTVIGLGEQSSRFKAKREQAVTYKGGKCERCNYDRCMQALEFHHPDPSSKDPDYSRIKSWSWDRVKKEIDKCILLCSICHREKHAGIW